MAIEAGGTRQRLKPGGAVKRSLEKKPTIEKRCGPEKARREIGALAGSHSATTCGARSTSFGEVRPGQLARLGSTRLRRQDNSRILRHCAAANRNFRGSSLVQPQFHCKSRPGI